MPFAMSDKTELNHVIQSQQAGDFYPCSVRSLR